MRALSLSFSLLCLSHLRLGGYIPSPLLPLLHPAFFSSAETALTSVSRIFVSLIVICHYPLQLHPARRSMLSILQKLAGDQPPSPQLYYARYIVITVSQVMQCPAKPRRISFIENYHIFVLAACSALLNY